MRSENSRFFVVLTLLSIISVEALSQSTLVWGRQFGSDMEEYVMNQVIDSGGNIYIAGKTMGSMAAQNMGKNDGFITKLDSAGNTLWIKQFGSTGDEDILWSAIDNTGCVYITGSTTGILDNKNRGKEDVFVIKYNTEGEMEWIRQFGTDSTDIARGIFADNKGFLYITGNTSGKFGESPSGKSDCFLMKLDTRGNLLYISQFGTPLEDYCYSVTKGQGSDIIVCGTTWGDIGAKNKGFADGFICQFTDKGKAEKYIQFGSDGFDIPMAVCTDNVDNIYVGGTTSGNFGGLQEGEGDAFLLKMNVKGELIWNIQFGTISNDGIRNIDFNPAVSENILVSGILGLPPGEGFIRMFSKNGTFIWERKFAAKGEKLGTSGKDARFDRMGNIYHVGLTGGGMFKPVAGEADVYIVKLKPDR